MCLAYNRQSDMYEYYFEKKKVEILSAVDTVLRIFLMLRIHKKITDRTRIKHIYFLLYYKIKRLCLFYVPLQKVYYGRS